MTIPTEVNANHINYTTMKKELLKVSSMLLMAVCLCVNFTACSDDDDDKNGTEQHDGDDDGDGPAAGTGVENGYTWVDLGLPSGVKWAISNVGTVNPWEFGYYFAWGETLPKQSYGFENYLDGQIRYDSDYGTDRDMLRGITDISGSEYDAVRVNMGGSWRMPTYVEQMELIANCYWEWTDDYAGKGVKGFVVYKAKDAEDKGVAKLDDNKGNVGFYRVYETGDFYIESEYETELKATYSLSDTHIFLPAAGYIEYARWEDQDGGFNLSSSLRNDIYKDSSLGQRFFSDKVMWYGSHRYWGLTVRGVLD